MLEYQKMKKSKKFFFSQDLVGESGAMARIYEDWSNPKTVNNDNSPNLMFDFYIIEIQPPLHLLSEVIGSSHDVS